jgi:hypothetical protein
MDPVVRASSQSPGGISNSYNICGTVYLLAACWKEGNRFVFGGAVCARRWLAGSRGVPKGLGNDKLILCRAIGRV